ncbi:MAG: hypothetical protein ACI4MP_02690 [Candidatus Ventricola sp.]
MKEAIRLTNKTAIALRRSAQRLRAMHFAAAVLLSLLLAALGVFLGLMWLPAVPIAVTVIALMDCAIVVFSRCRYLSLLGQAICTEAAAREIRAGRSESRRREQAISDLMRAKADVQQPEPAKKQTGERPSFDRKDREDGETRAETDGAAAPHRRRRQSSLQLIRSEQA